MVVLSQRHSDTPFPFRLHSETNLFLNFVVQLSGATAEERSCTAYLFIAFLLWFLNLFRFRRLFYAFYKAGYISYVKK